MRISCPYCGARDVQEFSYLGDATRHRPDAPAPDAPPDPALAAAFHDYVYLRDNPAGPHQELWYHGSGCRNWLVVTRNTATHAITAARFAKEPS